MAIKAVYVPWLHMHQPMVWFEGKLMGNLEKMLKEGMYDAKKMARAYTNPAIYVKKLAKYNPKVMLDFSGSLLESLEKLSLDGTLDSETVFMDREGVEDKIGNFLRLYKEAFDEYPNNIEWAGTGYHHPYFPATPKADWGAQIQLWRDRFKELFGADALKRVKGFWLPEMGIPGEPDLYYLIEEIKKHGYKWLILPAVNNLSLVPIMPRKGEMTRFQVINEPHVLVAKNEKGEETRIIAIVREPDIDQQAGCGAQGIRDKMMWVSKEYKPKSVSAPLLVPTGDGENGNVMMNEFFPSTFDAFFREFRSKEYESMLVSEYLERELKERKEEYETASFSEVEIKKEGGSWMGGHQQWLQGDRRLKVVKELHELSEKVHLAKNKDSDKYKRAYSALLTSETSCYVYWGSDYWFDQAEETMKLTRNLIRNL